MQREITPREPNCVCKTRLPARRQSHRPESPPCAYCHGQGDICHPGNADPTRKVTDWLYPPLCPRCGGTGKDPNP